MRAAFWVVILVLGWAGAALAHGGGVDAQGCHMDRKKGERHCHGAKPKPVRKPAAKRPAAKGKRPKSKTPSKADLAAPAGIVGDRTTQMYFLPHCDWALVPLEDRVHFVNIRAAKAAGFFRYTGCEPKR